MNRNKPKRSFKPVKKAFPYKEITRSHQEKEIKGEGPRERFKPEHDAPSPKGRKKSLNAGTMLFPLPAVLVTSKGKDGKINAMTVAWTGIVCSDPPMLSISVRPERFSYKLIKERGEFVVNLPSTRELFWLDKLGVISGREKDKIALAGFTLEGASKVDVPMIRECPVHLECKVVKTMDLGSHTMFLANIVNVQVNESLIDARGRLRLEKAGLIAYAHGFYYRLGKQMARFGFSVKKKTKTAPPKETKGRMKQDGQDKTGTRKK